MLPDVSEKETTNAFGYRKKQILKEISVYFNPGEMIGVMGPSGCGKTTFLDLMTGRRKTGMFQVRLSIACRDFTVCLVHACMDVFEL